jgi:hypothetical protein
MNNFSLGAYRLAKTLETSVAHVEEELEQALADEADLILRLAQEFSPLATGELVDSALAEPVEREGDVLSVRVGFHAGHSIVQHEDLSLRHGGGVRGAKYLQRAVDELSPTSGERLARAFERGMRRGLGG